MFSQRFSATPLGARLARHPALYQLHTWGVPCGSGTSDTAALLVAESATNAGAHDHLPGRDFELRLVLGGTPQVLCIDVSDTRAERRPPRRGEIAPPSPDSDAGRGLLLAEALSDRWQVLDRAPVGETVRAELDLAG